MRNLVDGLWLSATWVERLRSELGLAGLHQVWSERPAWYVWLAGEAGAFGLELLQAEQDRGLARGLFMVKYYPSPAGGLWESFSLEERDLAGVSFDQSGTPAFEAREHIPPHLFQVGALEIITNLDREWCGFSLCALSQCRWVGPDGGLARNVPGWRLSHTLLTKMLGLHAYTSKHTPVLAGFSQEPGLEVRLDEAGRDESVLCPQTKAYQLSLIFGSEPGRPPLSQEAWQEISPPTTRQGQSWEQGFSCRHYHPWEASAEGLPVLSPLWWSLAEVGYTSELASSCGCEHC